MLNKLTIRNFKRFEEVEIELGSPVVFVGPNNSGKTSALQALALWNVGLKRWLEKRSEAPSAKSRTGVAVNRHDLLAMPVPAANLLWRDLRTEYGMQEEGKQETSNIRIDISVEGETDGKTWECGLEFDYSNTESLYCSPLRLSGEAEPQRMEVPQEASSVSVAYLPPMSGLTASETRLDQGAINVRIGEGRTAEVLRNLCFLLYKQDSEGWDSLVKEIRKIFGAELDPPTYVEERGELKMTYKEAQTKQGRGATLDLSSSGRGLQQCLLLLAYLYSHPETVVLLDEPDVHLEILRQRQIYDLISRLGRENGNQVVVATHSEVLLNEAAKKDLLIGFWNVGRPLRIDDRGSQVLKSLKEIPYEQFLLAGQKGWVLYLEGPTDLAVLKAFARRLGHDEAFNALDSAFPHYVGNTTSSVSPHFHGLKEAVPDLKGVALFDRLESDLSKLSPVCVLMWKQREIENYLCSQSTLERFAEKTGRGAWEPESLLAENERKRWLKAMQEAIHKVADAAETMGQKSPWGTDIKASDEFLTPLFENYYKRLGLPNQMAKKSFYELAEYVPEDEIDPEISEKLDAIAEVAATARLQLD